jgi:hypothetical protein
MPVLRKMPVVPTTAGFLSHVAVIWQKLECHRDRGKSEQLGRAMSSGRAGNFLVEKGLTPSMAGLTIRQVKLELFFLTPHSQSA